MRLVFQVNENKEYVRTMEIEDEVQTPKDCTELRPPQGLFKAVLTENGWTEGATTSDIEAILNQPKAKTLEERLAEAEETIALLQQQLANK